MKHLPLLLVLILSLVFSFKSVAQTPQYYNYNTTGSTNSFPFNIPLGKQVQLLYLAGDFNQPTPATAGNITSVAFRLAAALGPNTYSNVLIKLGQANITTLPAGAWYAGQLDTVYYRASVSLGGNANEWMTITLDRPFNYNPALALIVDIQQCGAPTATGFSTGTTTLSGGRRNASTVGGGCPFTWGVQSAIIHHMGINVAPPVTTDSTLVIYNDSTATTAQRTADRDTLRKYIPMLIGKYRYMTKNTTTVFPDLSNYSTIIFQETSFDATTVRSLTAPQRQAIKDWLATGTPANKKSLIMIGADLGYAYDQTGAAQLDTVFSRSYGGFQYILDNGAATAPLASVGTAPAPGTNYNTMSITPPGASYWPDGCRPISGGTAFNVYMSRIDTVAGISKTGPGWNVVSTFQDPRYFTGAGQGTGDIGFKRVLKNLIAWAKATGGIIVNAEPVGSQIVNHYSLSQNYPNPFNPTTKINFSIQKTGLTTLKIYDILGREVMTLVNGVKTPGNYVMEFNASSLTSGTYFYRLTVNDFVQTKKMLLIK